MAGGPIVSAHTIRSSSTSNPRLAGALLALGIPFDRKPLTKLSTTGATPNRYVWSFAQVSSCGKYETKRMIEAWDNPDFVNQNPDHPFSYIKVAFQNHVALLDLVKQSRTLGVVEYRGKYGLIPTDLDQKEADKTLSRMEGR